jgi:hypothetical protein
MHGEVQIVTPAYFNEPSSLPTNTDQDEQNVYTNCHGVTTTILELTSVRNVIKITTGYHHVVGNVLHFKANYVSNHGDAPWPYGPSVAGFIIGPNIDITNEQYT